MADAGNEHSMWPKTGALLQHKEWCLTHVWVSHTDCALQTSAQCGASHGYGGVRLFGPGVYDVLQLPGVRDVVARLVLGQNLHQRTQLQPPLLLGDPVAAEWDERTMRSGLTNKFRKRWAAAWHVNQNWAQLFCESQKATFYSQWNRKHIKCFNWDNLSLQK